MRTLPVRQALLTVLLGLVAGLPASAQGLGSEPLVLANGRVTVGGDVSATFGCSSAGGGCGEDTGYFNYSDYEHSTLRMVRVDVSAAVKASPHLSILGEVRGENGERPRPYALYIRLRPWERRAFDIQIGRVPPTFGAFARRTYANDNLLIGYPLAYQYLTSLRPDAVPANADELLRMRGRGWLSSYSVGNPSPDRGLPIASAFRWDTGIQVHGATRVVDAAAAVTTGSLSHPLVGDDNSGKQVAGRVALRPVAGLVAGVSGARGPFLTRAASQSAGAMTDNSRMVQTAVGTDIEYSRGYYLVRFETILSDWTLPVVRAPAIDKPLRALGTTVEGRYKIHPRLYVAGRYDHLGFSTISGTNLTEAWEAPVSRVEAGGGYSLQRNLQVKVSVQRNVRDGGRTTRLTIGAAQVVVWF